MYRPIVIFQMKQTTIVGNIGRDAVCREGDGGHKFVSFSVAYAERKTGKHGKIDPVGTDEIDPVKTA